MTWSDYFVHGRNISKLLQMSWNHFRNVLTPKNTLLSGANSPNLNSLERFRRTMPHTEIRQAFCISMSLPPDGVNVQSCRPGRMASHTYSIYITPHPSPTPFSVIIRFPSLLLAYALDSPLHPGPGLPDPSGGTLRSVTHSNSTPSPPPTLVPSFTVPSIAPFPSVLRPPNQHRPSTLGPFCMLHPPPPPP